MRRPPRSRRRAVTALALALIVAVLAPALACSPPDDGDAGAAPDPPPAAPAPAAPATPSGGRLAFGLDGTPTNLNPATAVWSVADRQVALATLETLTAHDDRGVPRPELAEEVVAGEGGGSWTIRLRPGLALVGGRPVDAALVAEGLEALRASPALAEPLARVAAVEAVGPLEVVVTLSQPFPAFPHLLATQAGVVADPAWLRSGEPWHPVGTGPFVAAGPPVGGELVVRRNEGYWRRDADGAPLPHLDEVAFTAVADPGVRTARLVAGQLDAITTADPAEVARLRSDAGGGGDVQVALGPPGTGSEVVALLHQAAAPFDDPAARAAVALATDVAGLAATVRGEEPDQLDDDLVGPGRDRPPAPAAAPAPDPADPEEPVDPADPAGADPDPDAGPGQGSGPATSTTTTTVAATTTAPPPPFDAERAAEVAEQVAEARGGPLAFTLLVPADPASLAVAVAARDQWVDAGLAPTLEVVPAEAWAARVAAGAYQAALGHHPAAPHAAADLAERADRVAGGGADAVWLVHSPRAVAASPRVGGLVVAGEGGGPARARPLWAAWLVG